MADDDECIHGLGPVSACDRCKAAHALAKTYDRMERGA